MAQRRIGEVLVGGRAISMELRDRALAQQARLKGRFGTNLLEIGGIREELLLRALSVQHGTAPVTASDLDDVQGQVTRLVPGKLALSLFVVPFRRSGRTLSLAMRDPKDLPAIDEIAFLTGLAISPFVALDFRIQLALSRYYGGTPDPRHVALAEQLAPRGAGYTPAPATPPQPPLGEPASAARPSPAPSQVAPPVPPPPPSLRGAVDALPEPRPSALGQGAGDPWGGESLDAVVVLDEPPILTETLSSLPPLKPQPPISSVIELDDSHVRRLRGSPEEPSPAAPEPLPPQGKDEAPTQPDALVEAEAPQDLGSVLSRAESRDDVAGAVLAAAAKKLRRAALFIAQPDRVIGWASVPEPPEGLRSFSVSFGEPSLFTSLRNTDAFYVGPCPDLPANRRVLEALGASLPTTVAVVPVTLKGKSVLFLLGEADPGSPPPVATELKRLAAQTAIALEILLLRNRLRSL